MGFFGSILRGALSVIGGVLEFWAEVCFGFPENRGISSGTRPPSPPIIRSSVYNGYIPTLVPDVLSERYKFRKLSVFPTLQDILEEELDVPINKIQGSYHSLEDYLNTQFLLLREDFISPLRTGILNYCNGIKQDDSTIRVHSPIYFTSFEILRQDVCLRVKGVNFKGISDSDKRFMRGALVGFTSDNFQSLLFAQVIAVEENILIVKPKNGPKVISPSVTYIMIEYEVFFEPYFHVLNALKEKCKRFPMEKFLINGHSSCCRTNYIIKSTKTYNQIYTGLNDSQKAAYLAGLFRELAIIQGPPGTGKTFLGLRIAQTLIENHHLWHKGTPMLVICLTNHALDQFLEGLIPFTERIIRVGGQSKSSKLKDYNLSKKSREMKYPPLGKHWAQMKGRVNRLEEIRNYLNVLESCNVTVQQIVINIILSKERCKRAASNEEDMEEWLSDMSNWGWLRGYSGTLVYLKKIIHLHQRVVDCHMHPLFYDNYQNHCERVRKMVNDLQLDLKSDYKKLESLTRRRDETVMSNNLVIGMTTTAAARLRSSIEAVKCPIVIVEEAAEALESHIVPALTSYCKHLILLGDHKQLRPKPADYLMETKYNLGISLFERLILNGVECNTLKIQYRMRPEISSLINPIYPFLIDHQTVVGRANISGLDKNVFFLDHRHPEECNKGSSSKFNLGEAEFLIQFARYLVLNGYAPQRITILTTYTAQKNLMMQKRNELGHRIFEGMLITNVDEYQGEENDIILLSLVRNNHRNNIGYLATENRVCVALSRAKFGMYIMGNMEILSKKSHLWRKIKETLIQQNALGTQLPLRCSQHGNKITRKVLAPKDFQIIIKQGCGQKCGAPRSCERHFCPKTCHYLDKNIQCRTKCHKESCVVNKDNEVLEKCIQSIVSFEDD